MNIQNQYRLTKDQNDSLNKIILMSSHKILQVVDHHKQRRLSYWLHPEIESR
jgi:hypothetical protein